MAEPTDKQDPATVPDTPVNPDPVPKAEGEGTDTKEQETTIPIKQVPMDGICGGY